MLFFVKVTDIGFFFFCLIFHLILSRVKNVPQYIVPVCLLAGIRAAELLLLPGQAVADQVQQDSAGPKLQESGKIC